MHEAILVIHSILRWAVLLLVVFAAGQAWVSWLGRAPSSPTGRRVSLATVITVDLQILVGLLLFVLSPITQDAFGAMAEVMKDAEWRYWTVEHPTVMIIAVVLIHLGQALGKRAPDDRSRHKRVALFFTAALIAFVVGIPWPGMDVGRALLPGL